MLTKIKQRYLHIEIEMLAIILSLKKFNQYTYGAHQVKIQSDHKPLESILSKRLQGMMIRIQKYDYEVQYEHGMNLYLANTLSRAHLPMILHQTGTEFENINAAAFLPVSTSRLQDIQQATQYDEILQALKAVILHGWPDNHSQIAEQITPYFCMRDELSVHDGVTFCGQ